MTTIKCTDKDVKIGVLALQGAFVEHALLLNKLGVTVVEVRLPEQLEQLDGLIIPGGESTSIGLIAERWGFITSLRMWIQSGKPIWGVCAGMILLANDIAHQKQTGQPAIGGMKISVSRNFFGRQMSSFETKLDVSTIAAFNEPEKPYQAIFIRAPIIAAVGDKVEILASIKSIAGSKLIVAARQGFMLATAFHPELTDDLRWHQFFLRLVCEYRVKQIDEEAIK